MPPRLFAFCKVGSGYSIERLKELRKELEGKWQKYEEVDGNASFRVTNIPKERWGKGFNLSDFYYIYLWNRDKGSDNFSTWVG